MPIVQLRLRERVRTPSPVICEAMECRSYLTVTFASPTPSTLTGVQGPIYAAQFSGMAFPADLAVATPGSVKTLFGTKLGTFDPIGTITLPANPASQTPFLVGNFSGNGSDIVLLSQNSSTHNGVVTYEQSENNGLFVATATTAITDNGLGFKPIAAATNDFNGDGNYDLAIIGKTNAGSSLVLAILTSNADGSFTEAEDYTITGSNAAGNLTDNSITTASLDGGTPDIVLYDGSSGNLDVFMGAGDGSFTQLPPVPLTATSIITGTFTGSGVPDVIAADGTHLIPLLGNGDGTFTAQPSITLSGTISSLASADMDLDGNLDLITNLGVLAGNGDGTFQATVPLPIAEGGSSFSNNIITADLDGDGRVDIVGISSAGNTLLSAQNITPVSSTVSVSSNDNPANPGDDVQFTASVSSALNLTATGQVDFLENGNAIGSAQLQDDGTATFDAGTGLTFGTYSITAQYEGDSDFLPSASSVLTQQVLAPTITVVTSNTNPSNLNDDVTFTATVSGNDGNGDTPTGTIEFLDGSTDLGSATLDANGSATFDDSLLSGGAHQITAQYQADSNYGTSTSAVLTQTVNLPPLLPVVTATTLPAPVVAGTAAQATVTVDITNNTNATISGPVSLTVFASVDGNTEGATKLIVLPPRNLVVRATETVPLRIPIKQVPSSLTAGTYFLIAQATYRSGTVSAATTGPTIQVVAPFISLSESFPALKIPSPVVSGTRTNGSIKILITNNGNIPSRGLTTVALSLSQQQDQTGAPIPGVIRNITIKVGGSQTISVPIKSIPSPLVGDYFLVAEVTDPDGGMSTASPENTTQVDAPVIALSAALAPVTNINSGDTLTITNNGNIDDVTSISPTLGFSSNSAGTIPVGGTTVAIIGKITIKTGRSVKIHLNQWKSLLSGLQPGVPYYLTASLTDDAGNSAFATSTNSFTV